MKSVLRIPHLLLMSLVIALFLPAAGTTVTADFGTSNVKVNQIGYMPAANKTATVVSTSTSALTWELVRVSDSTVVASGSTTVYGNDKASGEHVHKANFSGYSATGTYKLRVSGIGESVPFDIAKDLYPNLPKQAMEYFYFHRMGTDILSTHLTNPNHAHAALHPGDSSIKCFNNWCPDTLNVRYSWADAGDFGIYPVNHAISAWTLLNFLERYPTAFPDGSLNIPEKANGVPDLLDEVKFGSTFMKGMLPASGLASHKVHNEKWSSFPVNISDENAMARYAQPPSTNATYALARNLAQLARMLNPYNATEASSLWNVAKTAWSRAEANPNVVYSSSTTDSTGGGDYGDSTISDDRYAAAVELYLTAYKFGDGNESTYQNAVTGSSHYKSVGQFDWGTVGATGTLSLLSVANDLPSADIDAMKSNVLTHAGGLLNTLNSEGYPTPLSAASGVYPWGSNSFIVNKMILMGVAYDVSGDKKYLKAMHHSMDYLMGNNAMKISYITGYGEFYETDTHDRLAWGAYQNGTAYPKGWLSGGPMNEGANCDPVTPTSNPPAKAYAAKDTAPSAWCSKENTINWNAPLVWVAQYINNKKTDLDGSTSDTQAPSVPSGVTATADSSTQVTVKWTASTDNVGVSGYNVFRDTVKIGSTTTTSYTDSTVSAGTTYSYTVSAYDAAGNQSAQSSAASVTTPSSSAVVIEDFENGISNWAVFKDSASTVTATSISSGVAEGAKAMQVDYSISSYGGVSRSFSTAQDWSGSTTYNFYLYGNNSGNTIVAEISDNGGSGTGDTYERFVYNVTDNFSGWKLLSIPFSSFTRRADWQPSGAPNDGFTLTEIHGISFYPKSGTSSFRLDTISLTGTAAQPLSLDDFEDGSISDWGKFHDANSTITPSVISSGAAQGTYAMNVDYSIVSGGYGGVSKTFSTPQDWTAYTTFEVVFYGSNSGNTIVYEISDNGGERFVYSFTDNFSGWKTMSIPFSSFTRRTDWQPSGAPNDGFTLTGVEGYAIYPKSGASSFKLDDIKLK
jgi:endoglucanase